MFLSKSLKNKKLTGLISLVPLLLATGSTFGVAPVSNWYKPLVPAELQEQGLKWRIGDLHNHTTHSDGKNTNREMIRTYQAVGHDFMSISDHSDQLLDVFGHHDIDNAEEWQKVYKSHEAQVKALNATVLLGLEKTVSEYRKTPTGKFVLSGGKEWVGGSHILIHSPKPFWIGAQVAVDKVLFETSFRHKGFPTIAHPYGGTDEDERGWEPGGETWGLTRESYPFVLKAMGTLGSGRFESFGMEVINGGLKWTSKDDGGSYASWINDVLKKGGRGIPVANSDSHSVTNITGSVRTGVLSFLNTRDALITALRAGKTYAAYGPMGVGLWVRSHQEEQNKISDWFSMGDVIPVYKNVTPKWEFFVSANVGGDIDTFSVRLVTTDLTLPLNKRAEVTLFHTSLKAMSGRIEIPQISLACGRYVRAELRAGVGDKYAAFSAPIWMSCH